MWSLEVLGCPYLYFKQLLGTRLPLETKCIQGHAYCCSLSSWVLHITQWIVYGMKSIVLF